MGFLGRFLEYAACRTLYNWIRGAFRSALLMGVVGLVASQAFGWEPLRLQLASTIRVATDLARRVLASPAVAAAEPGRPAMPSVGKHLAVCFNPEGRCGQRVAAEISAARKRVQLQAYTFTSRQIAAALVGARRRGVDVAVIVDAGEAAKGSVALATVLRGGVPVRSDGEHRLAHNKVAIADGTILTGSDNFSVSSEECAENVLVIKDEPDLARAYGDNWLRHWEHSRPLERP